MKTNNLYYSLALLLVDGVGSNHYQTLVSYCGSPEAVFKENHTAFAKIPQVPQQLFQRIKSFNQQKKVEEELAFIDHNDIRVFSYASEQYPYRLKHIPDKPPILFVRGEVDLSPTKMIAVVGSRAMTAVGKKNTHDLIRALSKYNCTVVSGLAMGVDVEAHKACVEQGSPTIGVLGHGLDRLYPAHHQPIAKNMLENGGLVTEFWSKTIPDRENFPKRNRIVAGMVDAVIVVESSIKGGSLITARLANGYHREVMAIPGRLNDPMSLGCNFIIKNNEAHLYSGIQDLVKLLNWDIGSKENVVQTKLFQSLNEAEHHVLDYLRENDTVAIDVIVKDLGRSQGAISSLLLSLEFKGLVASLPGKRYSYL